MAEVFGDHPTPLDNAITHLWEVFSDPLSLLSDLPSDAVLVRADTGELRFCLPRLLELLIRDELTPVEGFSIADRLRLDDWQSWPPLERVALESFFDAWWLTTLALESGPLAAHEVLSVLVHLGVPLVRWLGPWLEDLDGPAANHFAELVLSGMSAPAWQAAVDERGQVKAWTESEACVLGIALVGGIHLPEGQLSDVLDHLV